EKQQPPRGRRSVPLPEQGDDVGSFRNNILAGLFKRPSKVFQMKIPASKKKKETNARPEPKERKNFARSIDPLELERMDIWLGLEQNTNTERRPTAHEFFDMAISFYPYNPKRALV